MRNIDCCFNFGGEGGIGLASENKPKAICALLDFARSRDESFAWPALGRTIFGAGVQAEQGMRLIFPWIGLQPKLLRYLFHFVIRHVQMWVHRCLVCAQSGG